MSGEIHVEFDFSFFDEKDIIVIECVLDENILFWREVDFLDDRESFREDFLREILVENRRILQDNLIRFNEKVLSQVDREL